MGRLCAGSENRNQRTLRQRTPGLFGLSRRKVEKQLYRLHSSSVCATKMCREESRGRNEGMIFFLLETLNFLENDGFKCKNIVLTVCATIIAFVLFGYGITIFVTHTHTHT